MDFSAMRGRERLPSLDRPESSEYAPYYGQYITLVESGDILKILQLQCAETTSVVSPN